MTVQKLFCYVDETGQDTKGKNFIVSVVVTQDDREDLIRLAERLEQETGKKRTKWHKTAPTIKQRFIEQLFGQKLLQRKLFYSSYRDSSAYQELTVLTVAGAIHAVRHQPKYKASVFIDGLQRSEVKVVSVKLRRIGVRTAKVRGVRDESHALIRLADAIAGFVREFEEGQEYAATLHKFGRRNQILVEV